MTAEQGSLDEVIDAVTLLREVIDTFLRKLPPPDGQPAPVGPSNRLQAMSPGDRRAFAEKGRRALRQQNAEFGEAARDILRSLRRRGWKTWRIIGASRLSDQSIYRIEAGGNCRTETLQRLRDIKR